MRDMVFAQWFVWVGGGGSEARNYFKDHSVRDKDLDRANGKAQIKEGYFAR